MTGLRRRAPLHARVRLIRRSPLAPRVSRLRNRSRATEETYRNQRIPLVKRLLAERPRCEAGIEGVCTRVSTEIHEVLTRARGGSILDEVNCRALCHACHAYVTAHPQEAHRLGLMLHAWEKTAPKE